MTAPPGIVPWVGAYVGHQHATNVDFQALWDQADQLIGPLTYWRCFDNTIRPPQTAKFTKVKGPRVFYSLKAPRGDVDGFIRGDYTTDYQTLVAALPGEAKLTVWHEPENDTEGEVFAALTRRAYDDAKTVRPDIEYWYIAMAYQWQANSKGHTGTAAGWLEAAKYVDAVGIDVYAPRWDFAPLRGDRGYQRWRTEIGEASGKPWGVTERGISGHRGDAARADILADDWNHLTTEGATLLLYWQANWTSGNWQLSGPRETAQYRHIATAGKNS